MAGLGMNCTELVGQAYARAFQRHPETHRRWITASSKLGGRLPHSLLPVAIQRIGRLDMLLRSMEDEVNPQTENHTDIELLAFDNLSSLSDLWIGSTYEIFRHSEERFIQFSGEEFGIIAHHLRLIRIPLEKHEIAQDWNLAVGLELKSPPNNDASDIYVYERKSKARAHIMPMGMSERGAIMWNVIDLKARTQFWIERRELSDRVLNLLAPNDVEVPAEEEPASSAAHEPSTN